MKFFKGLLIFLLGAVVGIGGAAGGIYLYASTSSVSNVASLFGADASALVKEDYAKLSVVDFIKTLSSKDMSTLGGIAEISPMVDDFYANLDSSLQDSLGVSLVKEALYSKKFEDLGSYLVTYIKSNAKVGAILNLNASSHPALLYLCYPKNGDGSYDLSSGRTLSEFSTAGYLDSLLDNATLGDLLTISPEDATIYALKDTKINNLESGVKSLTLKQVVTITATSPKILISLQNTTIANLPDAISTLTLGDAIEITSASSKILQTLKSTPIDGIGTRINTLTIAEMIEIADESPVLLKELSGSTLETLTEDVQGLKITDVFANEVWGTREHTQENVDAVWKYMLVDADGVFHTDYTVCSDMAKLTENVKTNINKATMDDLYADGFISGITPAMLDKEIAGVRLGDMTFAQFIAAVQ